MKKFINQGNKSWRRITIWTVTILSLAVIACLLILDSLTYKPLDEAEAVFHSNTEIGVEQLTDGYRFEPVNGDSLPPDIIFYPGGLVEPKSYAPFSRKMAEKGYGCTLLPCP